MAPGIKPLKTKRPQWTSPLMHGDMSHFEHRDDKTSIPAPRRAGRPKFEPTAEQRADVELMACGNVSREQIAAIVHHPGTNKPISTDVLIKVFKDELANAKTRLQKKVLAAFVRKLEADYWPAIEFAMKFLCGIQDAPGVAVNINGGADAERHGIRVEFVTAAPKPDDPIPVGGQYDPRAPRPISKREMYNEASTAFPHRIDAKANRG